MFGMVPSAAVGPSACTRCGSIIALPSCPGGKSPSRPEAWPHMKVANADAGRFLLPLHNETGRTIGASGLGLGTSLADARRLPHVVRGPCVSGQESHRFSHRLTSSESHRSAATGCQGRANRNGFAATNASPSRCCVRGLRRDHASRWQEVRLRDAAGGHARSSRHLTTVARRGFGRAAAFAWVRQRRAMSEGANF